MPCDNHHRPSAVVFDIGGVLVDWNPRYLYRKLLPDEESVEWFLTGVCTPEWNLEQDRGRPWGEAVAQLSARFPEHAELIVAYHRRWTETVAGAIDDTVDVLRELRGLGVSLYALTNFSPDKFEWTRKQFGWFDWFGGIVVSGEERLVKPDPRIYQLLLDRYRLDAGDVVYVDDVAVNVDAARAVGMAAVRFTDPARLRADLSGFGLL